jgi:uncharacterized glyoxalase superfamily protein PhnB
MKRKAMKRSKGKSRTKPARRSSARAASAKKKVMPVPPSYRTVTPYLVCRGAAEAMEFYKKAFGAREKVRMPRPDGKVAHAEMQIGDSMIMLGEEALEQGATAPQTIGGTASGILLYVGNVDKAFAQATAAGATAEMPPTNMFWGDRYCKLADPFGHKWSIATHLEDVRPKEMARRAAEAFSQQQAPGELPQAV